MDTDSHIHREEHHVKIEAEIGEMHCLQAKVCQELLVITRKKLGREHGTDCLSETPEGTNLINSLISDFYSPEL